MSAIHMIELHAVVIVLYAVAVSCIYTLQPTHTSDKGNKNV